MNYDLWLQGFITGLLTLAHAYHSRIHWGGFPGSMDCFNAVHREINVDPRKVITRFIKS